MELSTTREATSCVPLDSFPAFHGTCRFNTEFTRALHLSLGATGCGKLTSFFEYEMPYEKGSYLATPCIWKKKWWLQLIKPRIRPQGSAKMTTQHPISAQVANNFANKQSRSIEMVRSRTQDMEYNYHNIQISSGVHPVSYTMGYRASGS
jgi:hypothetical protein